MLQSSADRNGLDAISEKQWARGAMRVDFVILVDSHPGVHGGIRYFLTPLAEFFFYPASITRGLMT